MAGQSQTTSKKTSPLVWLLLLAVLAFVGWMMFGRAKPAPTSTPVSTSPPQAAPADTVQHTPAPQAPHGDNVMVG